jgi:ubiquinol-cytochrome c reductase cytochrome b subunit
VVQFTVLFALLILLSYIAPAPLSPKANPFESPEHVKPDWFFLGAHQFLKMAEKLSFLGAWAPKVFGVLAQGVGALAVWFLPFWDRNPERHPSRRPMAIRVGIALVFFFLVMTLWGHFS